MPVHYFIKPAASEWWQHDKTSGFHECGPIAALLLLLGSSLISGSGTPCVDMAFCEATDGTFGQSTVFREGKSMSRCGPILIPSRVSVLTDMNPGTHPRYPV